MKERFELTENPGGELSFQFVNGTITLPNVNGGYIISSGCGSGKTENIKSLIRLKHNEGILYCVDSVESLLNMYEWIYDELIANKVISLDDVEILFGKTTKLSPVAEAKALRLGIDMLDRIDRYKDNPSMICQKKVVLITHIRFWTSLIHYFVLYRPISVPLFDGNFERLLSRGDVRGWLVFDETPNFLKPFFSMPRFLLGCYSDCSSGKARLRPAKEIEKVYGEFIKDSEQDNFNNSTTLGRAERNTVFNLFPKYYDRWLASSDRRVSISFRPLDLCQPGMNTRVLIFEGAGDLLFMKSTFTLLDLNPKYNGKVLFKPFDLHLKERRAEPNDATLDLMIEEVAGIVEKNDGCSLVVVWKDVGEKYDEADDVGSGVSEFANVVRSKLGKIVNPEKVQVTYYGATDTKSVNDYKDFQNIILCGKWGVSGNCKVKEFREAWDSDTTMEEYRLWYFVQLICRIGIRKHDGGNYNVFYSKDFLETKSGTKKIPDKLIPNLDLYFQNKLNLTKKAGKDDLGTIIREKKLDNRIGEKILKLAQNFPELDGLLRRDSSSLADWNVALNDLFKVIPNGKDRPNITKYKSSLTEPLRKFGIKLNII